MMALMICGPATIANAIGTIFENVTQAPTEPRRLPLLESVILPRNVTQAG